MIKMEVINDENQHFILTFDRPGRVEVSVVDGKVIAHVYDGAVIDESQEPLGGFDATLIGPFGTGNKSWESANSADYKPYIGYGAL